jgi:hypothetical protein
MKLESQIVLVRDLQKDCIARMQELLRQHYEGVAESQFLADLRAKNWAILLFDAGRLCGFSTQVLFEHSLAERCVKVLFSGDTIIEKKHWGSLALPVAWGRLMLSIAESHPGKPLYWLLTSKGYKTYRFLSVFFYQFYPCYKSATPSFEKALLESVAGKRFGNRFDPEAGVLRAGNGAQKLKSGIADLNEARLRDPHVAFFQQRNPRHAEGDELVCLAPFHPGNLKPYIRRQL